MSARTILTISICNFHFFILFVLLFFSFRRGSVTAAYAQLFVFTERPIMCNFLL